ncbi:NAD(P)-binding protein [Xylariaceae sp. FL1019]|nr:NAD(P)-binding protein [Xylariaceae sp. FL1019]
MSKIAIIGASGKLGNATLSALLTHNLLPASQIIALTSSTPSSQTWANLSRQGVTVRHATFEDPSTFTSALSDVECLFLISTPNISLDFGLPMTYDGPSITSDPEARGREAHHKGAIDAALSAGVKRIVYSSLAFGFSPATGGASDESKAGVMRAHLRTEAYLKSVVAKSDTAVTILREGLYSESWPLYLGYFDVKDAKNERDVVHLAGDGKICWTAIHDLGVASAVVLSSGDEFAGKTFYLSTKPHTAKSVSEIASLVGEARGKDVSVKIVGRDEHVRYYVEERKMPKPAVEWWVSSYEALNQGECLVDDNMLDELLSRVGLKPIPVEETVKNMIEA